MQEAAVQIHDATGSWPDRAAPTWRASILLHHGRRPVARLLRLLLLATAVVTAGCASFSGPGARHPGFKAEAARLESFAAVVDITLIMWPLNPGEPLQFDAWRGNAVGTALAQRLAEGLRARGYPVARAMLASQGGNWPEGGRSRPDRFAMVRSEADGSAADPSRRPIETSPFIIAPDLAARPDSRATLAALHKALRDRRVAAKSESETHVAPSAAVAALVAPNQAALVVLEVWATAPSPQLVLSAALVQVAEQLHGLTLPRSYRERHIDKAFAESLRLSVIETANGRVLWADDHAVDGGGSRPGSLESALDTLLSRLPRRP